MNRADLTRTTGHGRATPWGALLVALLLLLCSGPSHASPTPTEQVRATVDGVLAALRDDGLDQEARRARIRSLVGARFDYRSMSQRTLATNWKKATAAEKDRFVELFSQLLEATYMGRIEAYTDERVEYVNEKVQKDRALVDTLIVTKTADIPIRYKLIRKAEEWLVYDVVIEEVSLIQNYRNSYREIVQRHGIDGLLAQLAEKLAGDGAPAAKQPG
jgi:phospholipid transport system substrate-binding protein